MSSCISASTEERSERVSAISSRVSSRRRSLRRWMAMATAPLERPNCEAMASCAPGSGSEARRGERAVKRSAREEASASARRREAARCMTVRAQRRSKACSGDSEGSGISGTSGLSMGRMVEEPPRLARVAKSCSLARNRWSMVRRNVRKRPRWGSADWSQLRARRREKNSWVRSRASSSEWPRRRT